MVSLCDWVKYKVINDVIFVIGIWESILNSMLVKDVIDWCYFFEIKFKIIICRFIFCFLSYRILLNFNKFSCRFVFRIYILDYGLVGFKERDYIVILEIN